MSKTAVTVIGILAGIIIIGLVVFATQNWSQTTYDGNATTTVTNTVTQTTGTVVQDKQPSSPRVVTISNTDKTDTTVIVNGSVTPNGSFTSYWFEYGTSNSLANTSGKQTVGSGYVAIHAPAYITGLTKDTTYYFRLVAENQYGKASGTTYSFKTTVGNPPPVVGTAPKSVTLAASGVSRTAVNLNGEVTPNKGTTQYWFEYGETTNLGNTSSFVSAGDGSSVVATSISISNLKPLTTYYFRLNAQNQFGTVNGSILSFKTTGPASATEPVVITRSATAIGPSTATMRGSVNPSGAVTMYWFEYGTNSNLDSSPLNTSAKAEILAGQNVVLVNRDISGLSTSTVYYFRIVAENSIDIVKGAITSFKTK